MRKMPYNLYCVFGLMLGLNWMRAVDEKQEIFLPWPYYYWMYFHRLFFFNNTELKYFGHHLELNNQPATELPQPAGKQTL